MNKTLIVLIMLLVCVGVCFAQKKTPTEQMLEKQNDYAVSRPPGYLEKQKKENDRVVSHEEAMEKAWKGSGQPSSVEEWKEYNRGYSIAPREPICNEKFLYHDNFGRMVFAGSCTDNHHYYRTSGQPLFWID